MQNAQYRVIYFPASRTFGAEAWVPGLKTYTGNPFTTYTAARAKLDEICKMQGLRAHTFDGFYRSENGKLTPADASDGLDAK